ncbi:MAG: ketoacyl-ACP synthase III [Pseudobdellovibrionaceae bacterium]
MKASIHSISYYLPEKIVTNEDMELENPHWDMKNVAARAGVKSRHIANNNETALDLAKKACDKLLRNIDQTQLPIDGIIFCTQSPDYIMPSNSHLLHQYLKLPDTVMAFDFNLACSGFVYGLAIANSLISAGTAKNILLVTADTYSKYINKKDRSARVLFGDGAAVTFLTKSEGPGGFLAFDLASHGKEYAKFYIPAGGLRTPKTPETSLEKVDRSGNVRSPENIHMDGLGVWTFINSVVPKQIEQNLFKNNLSLDKIDEFIFHQASLMTLESLIKIGGINPQKVFINLEHVGNTVSASIPIALADAITTGRLKRGQKILISGFGVGLSYGTTILEYGREIYVY